MDHEFCQEQCVFYRYKALDFYDAADRNRTEFCRYRPDKPMKDIAALTDCPYEQDENIGSYPIEDLIADGIPITDIAYYWILPPHFPLMQFIPAWYTDRITQQIEYQRRRTEEPARKMAQVAANS